VKKVNENETQMKKAKNTSEKKKIKKKHTQTQR